VQTFLVLLKGSHLISETLKRGGRVICLARCGIESFFCFSELDYSSLTNVILMHPEAFLVLPAECKTAGTVCYGFVVGSQLEQLDGVVHFVQLGLYFVPNHPLLENSFWGIVSFERGIGCRILGVYASFLFTFIPLLSH